MDIKQDDEEKLSPPVLVLITLIAIYTILEMTMEDTRGLCIFMWVIPVYAMCIAFVDSPTYVAIGILQSIAIVALLIIMNL